MNKIFNLTSTFKALEDDDDSVTITGMASTKDFDRAGDTIVPEAWTKGGLSNFEKNPIILFNHDYNKPIGRATGLKVTENGLEMKAKVSKSAPDNVAQLVKEGILGAFSVGFKVKDADYLEETDGLKIKDAELFEVSVVSVPCNQAATFSLAKSFDSEQDYEDFKKTFKSEEDSSLMEKEMSEETKTPEIDLDAFAKKVAEETAAKIAIRQAEEKAAAEQAAAEEMEKAAEAAEAKAQQEEEVQAAIKVGVESGADRLMADMEAKMQEKDADLAKIVAEHQEVLKEKQSELDAMRESKRVFSDRDRGNLDAHAKDLMYAHMLGVYTSKGFDTKYGKSVLEKAGVSYPTGALTGASDDLLSLTVSTQIEKEVMFQYKVAQLFREIQMNSSSMVLPLQRDTGEALFHDGGERVLGTGATSGSDVGTGLSESGGTVGNYAVAQTLMQAHRLISTTFMDNHIDEEILVNLLPMLTEGVARSHAKSVDKMVMLGNTSPAITGLEGAAQASSHGELDLDGATLGTGDAASLTANLLLGARRSMGKYGLDPADVVYIVSMTRYYDLIADPAFADITDVGSDIATKITGSIGSVFGSPVVLTDHVEAESAGNSVAYAVNTANYVIPRLKGVTVEQDYEIARQRQLIVATQSLGFHEMFAASGNDKPCVKVVFQA